MCNIAHDHAKPHFLFVVCLLCGCLARPDGHQRRAIRSTEEWLRSFLFSPCCACIERCLLGMGGSAWPIPCPCLFLVSDFWRNNWFKCFQSSSVLWMQYCSSDFAISYIGPRKTDLRSFNEGLYRHVFLVGLLGSLFISTVNGIFLNSPGGARFGSDDHAAVHCRRHAGLGCYNFSHRSYQELCARVSEV